VTSEVVELTASEEGIPTGKVTSLDLLIQKLTLMVRLTGVLVSVVPNTSEQLTITLPSCRT